MNLQSQIELTAYGTSEGVTKAWDTRGRGKNTDPDDKETCVGENCKDEVSYPKGPEGARIPHLDNVEFEMSSNQGNNNIHFDKEAMKMVLRRALEQLENEDAEIKYLNTPMGVNTEHYATVTFRQEKPEEVIRH